MGINYADLEPVNEFCNWVWVPGFCYQSLAGPDFDRTVFSDLLLFLCDVWKFAAGMPYRTI